MDDEATVRAEALAKQTAREKLLRKQVAGEKVPPVIVGPLAKDVRKRIEEIPTDTLAELEKMTAEQETILPQLQDAWDGMSKYPAGSTEYLSAEKRAAELDHQFEAISDAKNRLVVSQDQRMRDLLYVDNPAEFATPGQWNKFSARRTKDYERGLSEARKLIGTGTVDDASVFVKHTDRGRSFQSGRSINLNTSARTKTTIHELGHWLEEQDSEVHSKALEFYDARTKGEKLEWLGDNYDPGEKTRRDKFLDPYMGKSYRRKATEIVSMGMEHYWDDSAAFARDDPEYFDFIFDLLRGR